MKIAIDFDGTLVEHMFPEIGLEVPLAFHYMKEFQKAGAKLILWTMRSDFQEVGPVLSQALKFCQDRGIMFKGINEGINDREWTTSPKAHANIYIDDAAFGCPLIPARESGRPMVDWSVVGPAVLERLQSNQ